MKHKILHFAPLLLTLILCSCGKSKPGRLPVYPAQGKVMVEGKAAEKVMVVLHPLDGLDLQGAPKPNGKTTSDGAYAISTYDAKDGAPAGKYAVLLFWFKTNPDDDTTFDRFQGRYANPAKPVLTIEIKPSDNNQLPSIDVK